MLRGCVGRVLWVVVVVVGSVTCVDGQTAQSTEHMAKDAHPAFEVAAIKRSDPDDRTHRFEIHGHRIVIENQTVQTMIEMSYGVHARQIVNAPPWTESERFDIQGVPDVEGVPSVAQFQELVKKLLQERFGLKFHAEKRGMARYTLAVSKGDLAKQLQGELDRPVVDETGLKGRYDFTLKWLRADAPVAAEGDADAALPVLFTALQEQAGLKVEPSKGEVE